jgi:diguanylate cyclase (GGDEF)-like protein
MEELAKVDSLTGLSNRRRLEEALEKEWARSYRTGDSVALLMIDADNFKSYNDSFGHTEGDECLRAIAGVARQSERRSTDLLARYGGEEFVFLLPTNDTEGAASIAESIRRKVEVIHEEQPGRLRRKVTVSIGCVATAWRRPSRRLRLFGSTWARSIRTMLASPPGEPAIRFQASHQPR